MAIEELKGAESGWTSAPPSDTEVLAQLDRIRRSADFDAPERDRKFLAYVIEETLAGRGERIKAYSIATEVFGRDSSFDPQTDPAVRIEAGRIRRALERYYLVAGRADPIVISIPKGAYVPTFTRRPAACPPATHDAANMRPTPSLQRLVRRTWPGAAVLLCIAGGMAAYAHFRAPAGDTVIGAPLPKIPQLVVEPFEDLSGTPQSAAVMRGLADEVTDNIARFKEIAVVAHRDAGGLQLAESGPAFTLQARGRLDGDRLRLGVRLIRQADGSVVWANTYDERVEQRQVIDVQAATASAVASDVAQPQGALFQASIKAFAHAGAGNDWQAYTCTLTYYTHRDDVSAQGHAAVQDCLERAIRQFPAYATAWALLSMTYVDAFRYRLDPAPAAALEHAANAAAQAVKLDPRDARALEAQMLVLYFQGEIDAALAVGAKAHAINPNDGDLAGEYGLRLALSGQWDRGCGLVVETVARNPGPAGYFETALAACSYFNGDYVAAERWARMAGPRANPRDHVMLLAILGQLGKTQQAQEQLNWLQTNAADMLDARQTILALRRPEDRARLRDGLQKAGLPVAEPEHELAGGAGLLR